MKVVINISQELFEDIQEGYYAENVRRMGVAIGNGKPLEQEPKVWNLDDARDDFTSDVYNILDFLPTNNEANRIIDSFDRVTSGIKQEPCEDCISKQAIIDLLNKEKNINEERIKIRQGSNYYNESEKIKEYEHRWADADYILEKIKEIPTVEPTSNVLDKIKEKIRQGKYAVKKGLPERSLIYANGWDDGLEVAIDIINRQQREVKNE